MILPNQLTVLRIILTPVFVYLFLMDDPLLKQISLGVFIIAAITDWYDGWLRGPAAWGWMVGLLWVGQRFLNFSNGFTRHVNDMVLPFYVLHQTVILLVPRSTSDGARFCRGRCARGCGW